MKMRHVLEQGGMAVGTLLLFAWAGTGCLENRSLPAGEQAGQWTWFYGVGLATACCGAVMYAFWPAAWQRRLEERVSWSLIIWGLYEGIYGLLQVYGYAASNHSLYVLTGTFYNPGPYSGYMAMVCPIALYECLRLSRKPSGAWATRIGRCVALFAFLLCLCVLPSGMSRSAWLAAGSGILFVLFFCLDGRKRIAACFQARRRRATGISVVLLCAVLAMGAGAFRLKRDSANGRLFIWKITCRAIAEKPWLGHEESFPCLYGEAQEKYFAAGNYTADEERIAGSPEYAFNEYLQLIAERGILSFVLVVVLLAALLRSGIRQKRFGICGAVCALAVFAMSSYPLQFPAFWSALLLLWCACVPGASEKSRHALQAAGLCLCLGAAVPASRAYGCWKRRSAAAEEWNEAKLLYHTRAYEAARAAYEPLFDEMKWNGRYLFEYGHLLSKLKQSDKAVEVLQYAERKCNDPMVLDVAGKTLQEAGRYEEAETCFRRAVHRLPSRIYPYYLLAKLYAEPAYRQPDKLEQAARTVLTKPPKIPSPAIEEMKKEIRELLHKENESRKQDSRR